ncbi:MULTISPECIES: hypothetical protein [Paenibacillus]|jgi:hypothetical protein|nr:MULTISPECIES: hypothetical protein [Paenibacillus]AUS26578.1 hypothetical protein C1A50_2408 [Paenibacillus polymyxa]KAE8558664.1 hypothetical protein BJH92_18610 [Paenibacillus polymyxa]KKD52498.1 hypothetical protein C400_23410 [Paenibacillus sp. ICGEB2008]MBZ6445693.1 hypothetical protein [Paenibacillus polymyxa]MCJ1222074.1 hypothetical protein [Paenibacillus polymyxa]
MNIVKKLEEGKCSIDELENLLEEKNPIVLYHAMTHIGKEGIRAEEILKKLNELSLKREPQDKLLGTYKVGDLAIATMIKLGEKEDEITGFEILDEFEKKMLFRLFEEVEW